MIALIRSDKKYKSVSFSLCSFHQFTCTFSSICPNILQHTLFSLSFNAALFLMAFQWIMVPSSSAPSTPQGAGLVYFSLMMMALWSFDMLPLNNWHEVTSKKNRNFRNTSVRYSSFLDESVITNSWTLPHFQRTYSCHYLLSSNTVPGVLRISGYRYNNKLVIYTGFTTGYITMLK